MTGMGSHQSGRMQSDTWLTPPWLLESLCREHGPFDLDPCAAVPQPWDTARRHFTVFDDGLKQPWSGSVWLNPPYGRETALWLKRLAEHRNSVALIFARTETSMFSELVWGAAQGVLFLRGRLHFHHADGRKARANAGAPSALVAYGARAVERIECSGLPGGWVTEWRCAS